ncbi:hypothetical protein [Sulfurospirillum multivorans]|uniref:Uncharacterized protein n=2 Tax=Sulfurospirillum multivorans TaxID=66821 RepID=A0AA86AP21_SULMK|nr:hypothetical protein [Sulfurospirillum multivorans]AHJ12337.1 hypothetical protein SMUL_1071 [Sulfurospirillum multivorans DSM 12446]AHJ13247.1 hypothetical protein SMUL_1992 [Sulfurospirillum multivorans DSM 12446]QEH05837.1 hypothetical protein SMN_1063 [Sulfurospirillum multivorans]QEH06736.1 hypothetical protein SMN_1971 [Sulfurospirillum multivorans]
MSNAYAKDVLFNGNTGGGMVAGGGSSSSANNASYQGRYTASNNVSYARSSSVSPLTSSETTVVSQSGTGVGTVKQYSSTNITNFNVADYVKNLTNASGGSSYTYYTDEQKAQMSAPDRLLIEQYEAMQKVSEDQNKNKQAVKDQTKEVVNGINYQQGDTLPSVLSQNAKALTQAINALTTTFTDQFTLLNNYMMGGLIYQQQFLDIKTAESGLKIESMEYNKTQQTVYDLDGNALGQATPRDLGVQKDAVVGIDHTDKINFEIPDELESDLSSDDLDISTILGYDDGADIFKEFYTRMGGTGL